MFNEQFLNDAFFMQGSELGEFKKTLAELEKHTVVETCNTSDITVLSVKPGSSLEDKIFCYNLLPGSVWKEGNQLQSGFLKSKSILDKGHFEGLINETINSTKLMFLINKAAYFTSANIIPTLSLRANMGGDFMVEPSLPRDIGIAYMFGKQKEATLVSRYINNCKKAFAIMSGKYTHIKQTVLSEILDNIEAEGLLGKISCNNWYIDHNISQIYVEFPDKAADLKMIYELEDDFVPGLYLATSGTGSCSLTVRGTWRLGKSVMIESEMKRKHIGEIDIEVLVEATEDEIFKNYTKLPEALCELMSIDITDPSWDLTDAKTQKKNVEAVSAVIKSVFKQIGLVEAIGKKQEKELYEEICAELNPTIAYTAYDIATNIMSVSERLEGLNKAYENQFAKAIGKAPYCKYEKKKSSKLALTA